MKKSVLFLVLLSINFFSFAVSKDEAKVIFDQGNKAYEAGNYEEALKSYKQLEGDFVSFDLLYNMGNSYYKLNKIPEAILYYERAKKISPDDEDLKTNLQIANQKVVDKIDKLPTLAITEFGNTFISKQKLDLWAWGSIIFLFIAVIFFTYYLRNRSNDKSRSPIILGLLFLVSSIVLYGIGSYGVRQLEKGKEAVIFSPKLDVLNQPNGDQTIFVLHAGTKVEVRNKSGEWNEIKIDNGSVGWVRAKDCKEI